MSTGAGPAPAGSANPTTDPPGPAAGAALASIAREAAATAPAGKWWSVDEDALLGELRRLGPAAGRGLEDAIAH